MLVKGGVIILGNCFLFATALAATPDRLNSRKGWIKVLIPSNCTQMFYGPTVAIDGKPYNEQRPDYILWNPASAKAMAYRDPRTSRTFYVESDARHVAAIDSQGKLLWIRNPFDDAKLCPYRTPRPIIVSLEAITFSPDADNGALPPGVRYRGWAHNLNLEHKFLEIRFDSSQTGLLDESTGDFAFRQQN